jgi:DHA2 family multidrug resistance protein
MDFMIAIMLGFPIGRTVSEQYGNYRVFASAFIVYAAASHLYFSGQSLLLFLSGRIWLGFANSLTVLLGQEVLRDEYLD